MVASISKSHPRCRQTAPSATPPSCPSSWNFWAALALIFSGPAAGAAIGPADGIQSAAGVGALGSTDSLLAQLRRMLRGPSEWMQLACVTKIKGEVSCEALQIGKKRLCNCMSHLCYVGPIRAL